MKRRWVWDPDRKELVERTPPQDVVVDAPMVHGDFKAVNVGGIVIEDRGHLRRYLKANNLAPYDPSVAKRARASKERAIRQERTQSIVNSYEHERNKARSRSRFG